MYLYAVDDVTIVVLGERVIRGRHLTHTHTHTSDPGVGGLCPLKICRSGQTTF